MKSYALDPVFLLLSLRGRMLLCSSSLSQSSLDGQSQGERQYQFFRPSSYGSNCSRFLNGGTPLSFALLGWRQKTVFHLEKQPSMYGTCHYCICRAPLSWSATDSHTIALHLNPFLPKLNACGLSSSLSKHPTLRQHAGTGWIPFRTKKSN